MTSRWRAWLRTGLLAVAPTLVLCVGMLEVGLRVMGRRPASATDGFFEAHGSTYRLRPDLTQEIRNASFSCAVATNALGLRDRRPGPRALGPSPYVAFVGDSTTFGNGVDYEASFVGRFAEAAAPLGLEVVNLAVGGHRFSDQETLLGDFLAAAPAAPSWVVVIFTKDMVTEFDRDSSSLLVRNGYLFSKERWVVPLVTVTLRDASAAYGFFRDAFRRLQGRSAPESRAEALACLEDFSPASRWARPATVARLEARLDAFEARLRAAGVEPVYVYLPVSRDLDVARHLAVAGQRAEDHDFRRFSALVARHAGRRGIPFVDVSPPLEAMHAAGAKMTFLQDPHYDATVHQAIADALVTALLRTPGGLRPGVR